MIATNAYSSIIVVCVLLIVAVLAGLALVYWVKRRVMGDAEEGPSVGLTLEDLRRLHREGKLSAEEYERARSRMVAGMLRTEKGDGRGEKKV